MRTSSFAVTPALLLAASLSAQPYAPAWRDLPIANRTSQGSSVLQARVYYPGVAAGQGQALVPNASGYPVYVFLHGLGSLGQAYWPVGDMFAQRGWVCVLPDTAVSDSGLQLADAKAMFASLVAENASASSVLNGALDMTRCAVGGFSMGGGSAMRALAANVGYAAAFVHAPAGSGYASSEGKNIRKPFGVVIGQGDQVVGWQSGYDWWNKAAYGGQKVLYLLNGQCDHNAVISAWDQLSREIYLRCMAVSVGFLEATVLGIDAGWDAVAGKDARSESRLVQIHAAYEQPVLWTLQSGRDYAVRTACEPGEFGVLACATRGSQQTVAGTLGLDPGTMGLLLSGQIGADKWWSWDFNFPVDPVLLNKKFYLQSVGANWVRQPALSKVAEIVM
jgi:dienelactone hydrolase